MSKLSVFRFALAGLFTALFTLATVSISGCGNDTSTMADMATMVDIGAAANTVADMAKHD